MDGLRYSGLGDRAVLKVGSLHGIGDRGGWREQVFGGPPDPPGPHGPLPFLGVGRSSIPYLARPSFPACLSKRFLLWTTYQELGFVYDFWIKYGRKGVSPPGSR